MTEYVVHYMVNGSVYESRVGAENAASAMKWVMLIFPQATNMYVQ